MYKGEDESSSALNGRLRPRKSNGSPHKSSPNKLRKSDGINTQDKPKRNCTLSKASPDKTDDLVNKSESTIIPQHLCPFCDKKFVSKQTALKHAHRIHISSSKQDLFIDCLFCNHVESESNSIIRHMVDSHPNQYFACLDCHTRLPSTSDLAEHKLNVCEKQKLSYRSKLRQKSSDGKKKLKSLNTDAKDSFRSEDKEFPGGHNFNGIVISCELKPTHVHEGADIEDNITTNLILPSGKAIGHKAIIDKNAIIVLDDIQWNKRIPSNFSFHNADTDQFLSRLGVVHKSPRTGESAKKDWHKNNDDVPQKFEKCFDTHFYSKVASNVHENLAKYLDGSFNPYTPDPNSTIKTRKSKNCVAINAAEGFPILLACEQFSREVFDGYMPRAIASKYKWKWDYPENDRGVINSDQIKRDSHINNCIITYVSNLDIWTQLSMRRKFEDKFKSTVEKKTEKQNIIGKELKEILESREIPITSYPESSNEKHVNPPIDSPTGDGSGFPFMLGLTPITRSHDVQPAVLSGEWVRPRCYVCCACGAQTRDPRGLSSHISTQHPNASVQHYEIVGESLLDADILKHLYVPPSQTLNRTRPPRGFRDCTKCKKSVTLEDLHQHMLDCAGDTPTVRRKCRYRPFNVRKRRPRLPDNRIRKKMRKDMRTGQANDKNHIRPRPKCKSEVGDAETIRKMLADLPAKRHRVVVNPLNPFPRRKHDRKCNSLKIKKRSVVDRNYININEGSCTTGGNDILSNLKPNECGFNNDDDEDDDDDLPLKPKTKTTSTSSRQKEALNRKATMNRSKRKSTKELYLTIENSNNEPIDYSASNQPLESSIDNTPNRININSGENNAREHSNSGGSNNRDNQQPGSSRQNGNPHGSGNPPQNVPLKHSIASLTADSETHDKSVQFHRLFLVQQECNNLGQRHLPSDRRLLFENEAVVTKLDKPPLHFNQMSAVDFQKDRKNKLNKPRKRLNECIAMLKNKLTPSSEGNVSIHVSVQCGSDDPIEQEPFMIEESAKPNEGMVTDPVLLSPVTTQEIPLMKASNEHNNFNQLEKISHKNNFENENCLRLQRISHENRLNHENKTIKITQKDDTKNLETVDLAKVKTPEIDNSQNDITPLPLPRNTVIRKSPKMSVNVTNSQEDARMQLKSISKVIESISSQCTTENINNNTKQNDLPSTPPIVPEPHIAKSQLEEEPDKITGIQELPCNNSYPSTVNTKINTAKTISLYYSPDELLTEKNIEISPKRNVKYSSGDFHNILNTIPPAHASTNVESIILTPLDLSGKKSHTSESSSNEDNTFVSSRDSYETLDLSNKNLSIEQSHKIHGEIPTDVVVDLSIKSAQSASANILQKTTVLEDDIERDLLYEDININLPTDLSLKKKNDVITPVNLIAQNCDDAVEFVQDLSRHKTERREVAKENSLEIEYGVKELPTDLSSDRIEDNNLIIEIIDIDSNSVTSGQDLNNESAHVDITAHSIYEKTGVHEKVTRDLAEPLFKSSNDHVNMEIQENKSTFTLDSTDNDNSSRLNISPRVTNRLQLNETVDIQKSRKVEFERRTSLPIVPQECEIVKNQTAKPFIENTIIVPQETMHYEVENSTLSVANANSSSLPIYSKSHKVTTEGSSSKYELDTTVDALANVCVSDAKPDTSRSPSLGNSLPNIPSAASSTASINTLVSTSVGATDNFIDLSSETESLKTQNYVNMPSEHYDLTKEETINCDLEQDTETARKIAMLPKELVKILGTMPVDHRKQLLDILPQYVSNSTCNGSGVGQKSNISTTISSSPEKQQAITTVDSYGEDLAHEDTTQCNVNSNYKTGYHTSVCVTLATSSKVLQDSIPRSVILKAPVTSNDIHQPNKHFQCEDSLKNTLEVNRTVSVLNCPSKVNTFEEAQNMIIDLTGDENIQEIHDSEQVFRNNLPVAIVSNNNLTLQSVSEPQPQKGSGDQTASLRAVRIKAPSERNKLASSDYHKDSHSEINLAENNNYASGQILNTTQHNDNQVKLTNEIRHTSPDQKLDVPKSLDEQSNSSEKKISESSVILTPTSLDKTVRVSLGKKCGKRLNRDIEGFAVNSTQNIVTNDANNLEVNNTSASNTVVKADDSKLIESVQSSIENCSNHLKEKSNNIDEDSEDDISLAVIVKQKRREETQLSCDKNTLVTTSNVTNDCKKKKKEKRSKKVLLQNVKNDDEMMARNKTNDDNNYESLESVQNLTSEPNKTEYHLEFSDLATEENRTFVESCKRKTSNRHKTVTLTEVCGQTKTFDDPVSQINQKGNYGLKSDLQNEKLEDIVTAKICVQANFNTPSDAKSSSSIEFREDAIIQLQKDLVTVEDHSVIQQYVTMENPEREISENRLQVSNEKCNTPKENINLENKKIHEKLQSIVHYENEHNSSSTTHQLNLVQSKLSQALDVFQIDEEKAESTLTIDKLLHQSTIKTSDIDFKCKKSKRGRKYKNKYSSDSCNSQSPLRRSRRGKSLFVDSVLLDPTITTESDAPVDKKGPLTKKQLIFTKLLLDRENVTKRKKSSIIAKNPVVVINTVDLSSHISSTSHTNDTNVPEPFINNSKLFKITKRKKSPQSKIRAKKLKSSNDTLGDVSQSLPSNNNSPKSNKNCIEIASEENPIQVTETMDNVTTSTTDKAIVMKTDTGELQNKKSPNLEQSDHIDNITKSTPIEKRKMSYTVDVDINNSSTSKKSKFDDIIVFETKKKEEEKQDTNESSRVRNNNIETRNKTCYNNNVAGRRTRSKSVVVKSSTSLYDPYDIELEDMVDRDESYGGCLKSSNNALNKSNFVRDDETKELNKSDPSVDENTEMTNHNTITVQKSNKIDSKDDANDSDDSGKSDVPLKQYVEEKEKRNLVLGGDNINQSNTSDHSGRKTEENPFGQSSSQQENEQELKSKQFMESFGFFSERKPRKSNLIATKKISETFHANETDDPNDEADQPTPAQAEDERKQRDDHVPRDASPSPPKKPGKRGSKKINCTKPLPCYCCICKKEFNRPDNYLRHQMTLFHISKLSEVEMKIKTTSVLEEPNYLIAYKQQLDLLKMLTDKVTKKKKTSKATSKITVLDEVLAGANKTVREQQLSRRNLSRDQALFIDCCELLKESHKPDLSTSENVTITSDVNRLSTTSETPVAETSGTSNSEGRGERRNDGDVDSITAKIILESEEVRNLENDLIFGLKEAAANSISNTGNDNDPQPSVSEIRSDQIKEGNAITKTPVPKPQSEELQFSEKITEEFSVSKPKKNQEPKDKLHPDVIESIDIFEDKFDKIKRKCRSQAAAAKQVKPVVEPSLSQRGRKKSDKKKGKKNSKTCHYTIPTKGALKVFDGIKVSIPTSDINMSGVVYSVENAPKKRKRNNTKKKGSKNEIEIKNKNNSDYRIQSTQTQNVDVYEFMDNDDAELFEFRPSTLMERFKNINNKEMPSTSKYVPCTDKTDFSSESGSDGDDFVYDDYVCSDDETENSLMSCELGNGKIGNETKKSSSLLKRKDVGEKNAVMGKIFKHNALRSEKKFCKMKDHPKPKANLDQLFDSLLEDEPGTLTSRAKTPEKDQFVSPKEYDFNKNHDSATPQNYECSTSRKTEPSTQKKHEFSTPRKHDSASPKKPGSSSSKKLDTALRQQESERKHDSGLSRKHEDESMRKHHSTSSRKYECLLTEEREGDPAIEHELITQTKYESAPGRKHDATSKYNSGKVYPLSLSMKTSTDVTSKKLETPFKTLIFGDRPSTSREQKPTSHRDIFRMSPKKYDSPLYRPSIDEPSTSKINYDGDNFSKNHEYSSLNDYPHTSITDYNDTRSRSSSNKSATPELDNANDSDCGPDNVDNAGSDDAGVARQRVRRKCTVGKQNVLAESWSSESDGCPARPNSAESVISPNGRKKKSRKREGQLYATRRARQMPIKRQDVEARVAIFKRSRSRASSGSGEVSRPSSSGVGTSSTANMPPGAKPLRRPSGSKARSRSTAYFWSSDGEEEQEHLQQHGWIVGDSHKKLVTMLAHAKGRKRNHDDKRHNVE